MIKLLEEIDELLTYLEDTAHGEEGKRITEMRYKILTELSNSHKHGVMQGLQDVTRVEVIDEKGRSYVNWNRSNKVELQIQDEGRTLKAFIVRSPTVGKAGEDASMSDGK